MDKELWAAIKSHFQPYEEVHSDPDLWKIKAEETRTVTPEEVDLYPILDPERSKLRKKRMSNVHVLFPIVNH